MDEFHAGDSVFGEGNAANPSPKMFQALADGIPQLAWIADAGGDIHWFNKRWFEFTGTSLEDVRGWGWRSVHHPDHVERVVEKLARAFATGEAWEDTFPLRGRDGSYRWFLSRAEPVRDEAGRAVSWFGTNTDITEQLSARQEAEANAERLRLAHAAGAIIGTWFYDLRRDRFLIDEPFAQAFGLEAEGRELSLEQVTVRVHPEDRPHLESAISDAVTRGGRYAHQYRVLRADGNYYWIEANGRVDHASDGTPVSFPGVILDIEESRATAAALRDTSRRLNAILDNTQLAVFLMDERQHCVYANAAAERLTGYTIEQLQGRPLHDVLHHTRPDGSHYPIEECPIDRAFPSRAQMQGEELFVAPDGSFYPVAFTASPITEDDGRPIGTVIEVRNIAEEKAREAALRESEARQRSILNAIPQMVWTARADGYTEFYNARWYEFTGVAENSTNGDRWSELLHPEDRERVLDRWRRCHSTGVTYETEYRLRNREGEYRWVLGRALPVRGANGIIDRWMGTCTEIDDLKRTSDELLRISALLRLISDSTPDLIYAKDIEGRVLYTNLAVQQVVGKPLEEIVGQTDLDFSPDRSQARKIMANERSVVDSGETLEVDETYTGADGQTRHFRSLKAPLRTADGQIVGIVGVSSDMTKRREAEERERLLTREIDHRAKNMLGVVQSLVNLTKGDDPEMFRKTVTGRIQALARSHNLLSASRWEGVNLQALVREELAAFAGKVQLSSVAGPDLRLRPETTQSLGLVLHELTTNAAKYGVFSTPEGKLDLAWEIETIEGEPMLRMTWRELNGPPVDWPSSGGFGSILMRSSIEQLGGKFEIDWRKAGIVCKFSVPVEADAAPVNAESNALASHPAPGGPPATLAGMRVLLVEDEVLIAMEIKAMLSDAGCDVIGPATSVDAGLRLIAEAIPDAALLDVNLGARGFSYDLADELIARKVPFAFCTGYANTSYLPERFADAEILAKPYDRSAVISVLASLKR